MLKSVCKDAAAMRVQSVAQSLLHSVIPAYLVTGKPKHVLNSKSCRGLIMTNFIRERPQLDVSIA